MRYLALSFAAAVSLLVVGCTPLNPSQPSASSAAPVASTTTLTIPPSTATPSEALGVWTPTCKSADADAAALAKNLAAQPDFAGDIPSEMAGFADAAAKAVAPLRACPVVHSLTVKSKLAIGTDEAAAKIVQTKLAALLRSMTLSLSSTKVGRAAFGTPMKTLQPVLVAVLGKPDRSGNSSCSLSGEKWSYLAWGSLTVSFDASKSSKPLDSWQLTPAKAHPQNIKAGDKWPFEATLAQLKKLDGKLKQTSLFGTDAPWLVEATPTMHYIWDDAKSGPNDGVTGGAFHTCE